MRLADKAIFGQGVHESGFNVYLVTNTQTQQRYVGATTWAVRNRWQSHVLSRWKNRTPLQRAINIYGVQAFRVERVAVCSGLLDMFRKESEMMLSLSTKYPQGYNDENGDANRKPRKPRKAKPVTKSHRFTPEVAKFLDTVAKESEFIESLIHHSPAFRSFAAGQGKKGKKGE